MRSFIDARPARGPYQTLVGSIRLRAGDAYDEVELVTAPGLPCYVTYQIPQTSSFSVIVACFADAFDRVIPALSGADEKLWDVLGRAWPVLLQLLYNGQNEQLQDAGLVRIRDPDDQVRKWFVATLLDEPGRQGHDRVTRTLDAVFRVLNASLMCLVEGGRATLTEPAIAAMIPPSSALHVLATHLEVIPNLRRSDFLGRGGSA